MQAVFDTVEVCISIVDPEMRIINCNENKGELLVSDEQDIIGRYCHEVYCGKDSPSLDRPAVETLATASLVHQGDKEKGNISDSTSPQRRCGRVTGAIEVSIDVTEKKKVEEAAAGGETCRHRASCSRHSA